MKNIIEFKSEQTFQKNSLTFISGKISDLENLVIVMTQSTSGIGQVDSNLNQLKSSVADASEKLVDIEDRRRRSNLVIYGLAEKVNETEDYLKT